MFKDKIRPSILFALLISSIAWLPNVFISYSNQEIGSGVLYTLLFIVLFGLAVWGFISNKILKDKKK